MKSLGILAMSQLYDNKAVKIAQQKARFLLCSRRLRRRAPPAGLRRLPLDAALVLFAALVCQACVPVLKQGGQDLSADALHNAAISKDLAISAAERIAVLYPDSALYLERDGVFGTTLAYALETKGMMARTPARALQLTYKLARLDEYTGYLALNFSDGRRMSQSFELPDPPTIVSAAVPLSVAALTDDAPVEAGPPAEFALTNVSGSPDASGTSGVLSSSLASDLPASPSTSALQEIQDLPAAGPNAGPAGLPVSSASIASTDTASSPDSTNSAFIAPDYAPGYDEGWTLSPGSLADQLGGWCDRAGWTLVWKAESDVNMHVTATMRGTFEAAVEDVFQGLHVQGNALRVVLYRGNQVLEVKEN